MNDKNMKPISKTDWSRMDSTNDEDIDLSDIPELTDEFFASAVVRHPDGKIEVRIKIDEQMFSWFAKNNQDWRKLMIASLQSYIDAHRAEQKKPDAA